MPSSVVGAREANEDTDDDLSDNDYPEDQSALAYSSDDSMSDAYFSRAAEPRRSNSLSYSSDGSLRRSGTSLSSNYSYGALDPIIMEHEQLESVAVPPRHVNYYNYNYNNANTNAPSSSRRKARKARKAMQQQQRLMQQLQDEQEDHYEDEQWIARHHHQQVILRGKVQPEKWHDVCWLILFLVHLLIIVACAASFGTRSVFLHSGGTHTQLQPSSTTTTVLSAPAPTMVFSTNSKNSDLSLQSTASTIVYDDDALLSTFFDPSFASNEVGDFPSATPLPTTAPAPSSYTKPLRDTMQPHTENYKSFQIDYQTVMEVVTITGIYACILSTLTVGFMLIIGKSLIQTALIFTMVASLVWGLFGLAIQHSSLDSYDDDGAISDYGSSNVISVLGFCALGLTLAYTLWVWNDSLPLSATHVHTALCGMRESSSDTLLMGMAMLVIAFGWCMLWSMAFIGIVDSVPTDAGAGITMTLYVLLISSLCWTNLVIKNIVQVTVASAVGVWWFEPDSITPCCIFGSVNVDNKKKPALLKSVTTSLGSICLGSLVLLPVQIYQFLACCLPERYRLRHINRYAYSYVGLYGYSFMDAGRKARQLFDMTGGWRLVADDHLIHLVLLMVCVGIAGSTGTFGVLVEEVDGYEFTTFHKPIITAFVVGCTFGFVLSNILLLGVLDSSVNTVLVCFAASPREFHQNHPRLSSEMREVWTTHVWRARRLQQPP